jgi:predicted AAA+ superfamily ATPase
MFRRNILKNLNIWKTSSARKPLILRGARQVGKTSAVRMFGEEFNTFIELNLELAEHRRLFQRELSVQDLWQSILLSHQVRPTNQDVLLFIDEIQNAPEAIAYLRYFLEDLPGLHVVGAGSLLEMRLGTRQISFPVGRVEFMYMYPLSFVEYLHAAGHSQLVEAINEIPLPGYALDTSLRHFHRYTLIGGMPEVVDRYLDSEDVSSLGPVYHTLQQTYLDDVEKYSPRSAPIIRHCIEMAPFEAAKRIKFGGFGQSNYKSREISEALRKLQQAMLLNLLYPTTSLMIPAQRNRRKAPRLQFLDTGLINHAVGLQGQFFEHSDLHAIHRGLLAEHVVGQELLCHSTAHDVPLFWVREKNQSTAEVDYVINHRAKLIPIEVKAGKTGTLRSLHQFMDQCPHIYAVRLHSQGPQVTELRTPAGKAFQLLNMPYFLAGQIPAYLDWLMGHT